MLVPIMFMLWIRNWFTPLLFPLLLKLSYLRDGCGENPLALLEPGGRHDRWRRHCHHATNSVQDPTGVGDNQVASLISGHCPQNGTNCQKTKDHEHTSSETYVQDKSLPMQRWVIIRLWCTFVFQEPSEGEEGQDKHNCSPVRHHGQGRVWPVIGVLHRVCNRAESVPDHTLMKCKEREEGQDVPASMVNLILGFRCLLCWLRIARRGRAARRGRGWAARRRRAWRTVMLGGIVRASSSLLILQANHKWADSQNSLGNVNCFWHLILDWPGLRRSPAIYLRKGAEMRTNNLNRIC